MKSTDEIRRIAAELEARYGDRNTRYRQNWLAYKGEFDKLSAAYDWNDGTDRRKQGRPKVQVWNVIKPIVDTHRLLINRLPAVSVPAIEYGEPELAGKTERIEKTLYALWDASHMTRKHGEACFNIALDYASPFFVRWDTAEDIPILTVRSPAETYPVMKRNGSEVSYCLFISEDEADNIAAEFPDAKELLTGRKGSATVKIIEYVDENQYTIVVGDKKKSMEVGGGRTGLKQCPVVLCVGSHIPGEVFPPGPIDQLVSINDYLNRFQTKWGDALENVLFGFHVVTAEDEPPFNTGPNAVNYLGPQDGYQYVQPQAPPSEVFGHLQMIQQFMRMHANWPESASGAFDASIVTGRAITKLQGVMSAMAGENQANMAESLQDVNKLMLKMMDTYKPKKRYALHSGGPITSLASPGRPQKFVVEIIPERDIQGYYYNQLYYSPFGSDMNQALTVGMQMVQSDIASHRWVINQVPGIDDAEGMVKEIEEEKKRRMKLEMDMQNEAQIALMQAQQQMQPQQGQPGEAPEEAMAEGEMPPGGAPPGGPQAAMPPGGPTLLPVGQPSIMGMGEPLSGEEGLPLDFTQVLPFNQALSGLAPEQAPPAQPTEEVAGYGDTPVTLDEAVQALSQVKKLKGEVYLIGDIVKRGQTTGVISIAITDKLDKQTILNALRQWHSRLTFTEMPPGQPPNPNVPITEGVTGGVPTQAEAV